MIEISLEDGYLTVAGRRDLEISKRLSPNQTERISEMFNSPDFWTVFTDSVVASIED
jgi:hypothetical protein